MHTLVKLMLRFTTKVTVSPAWRRRISSAARVSACRSRPVVCASVMPSATETSAPSRARSRIARTSRAARSSVAARLPAAPVLMRVLYEAGGIEPPRDTRAQPLVEKLGARRVLGIDRQPFAEGEAELLGGCAQLTDEGPRLLRIDVVERERRDAAPVVEPGGEQPWIRAGCQVRRRLDVHVRAEQQS